MKTTKTCVLLHVCFHPPLLTGHNISMIYCTEVHEFFTRRRGFIGDFGMGIPYTFCHLPNRCKMPAQTIRRGMLTSRATKLVAMTTSLDRSSPRFSPSNFFIDDVNAKIRLASIDSHVSQKSLEVHPLSNDRSLGDIKKIVGKT